MKTVFHQQSKFECRENIKLSNENQIEYHNNKRALRRFPFSAKFKYRQIRIINLTVNGLGEGGGGFHFLLKVNKKRY